MKTKDILQFYLGYYDSTRGIGHTYAAIHGAKTPEVTGCHDGPPSTPILLCVNTHSARSKETHQGAAHGESYKAIERLRGEVAPIVWDNDALYFLFSDAIREIEELEMELAKTRTMAELPK